MLVQVQVEHRHLRLLLLARQPREEVGLEQVQVEVVQQGQLVQLVGEQCLQWWAGIP